MSRIFLCILAILGSNSCMANDVEYTCPPYIMVTSSIESPPIGWQVLKRGANKNGKHFLEYVVFTDGHPQYLSYLRPNLEEEIVSEKEKIIKSTFDLSSVTQDEVYLVCGYARTTAILSKVIGSVYKGCEVLRSSGDKMIKSVRCK